VIHEIVTPGVRILIPFLNTSTRGPFDAGGDVP